MTAVLGVLDIGMKTKSRVGLARKIPLGPAVLATGLCFALVSPRVADAAVTIERAEDTGTGVKVQGIGALPNTAMTIDGVAVGSSDDAGDFRFEPDPFDSPSCVITVSDGNTSDQATLDGCTPTGCVTNADCDDGLFCNGAETCDAFNVCQPGTDPCNDGVACTDDTCDEFFNSCSNIANDANCNDGLFCNGVETCDPVLDCQAGTDPCAPLACNEATDTCGGAGCGAAAGFYAAVDATNATTLRATLHPVIDDHLRFPYTAAATDTWDILELADEDPNNAGNILDVYKNSSFAKTGGGGVGYNREHTWPKSYGFPIDNAQNMPFTDCHMLYLSEVGYNSSRSNKPYRICNAACLEKETDVNDGRGGGVGVYPGNSNWTEGAFAAGTWETWVGRRGDVARAQFYMDIRYEGGVHGVTGVAEPDLILTDDPALIVSDTGNNLSVAHMGELSVLLQWHAQDPVDANEQCRNDTVFSFQGNRNPFIDHPEWVECLFNNNCGCNVNADCDDGLFCNGTETCVAGSCVAGADPCPGQNCDEATDTCADCFNDAQCDDGLFCNGPETCVANLCQAGTDPCAPLPCNEGTDTCGGGGGGPAETFINEFHYDNSGADTGEFVEIAGPAGNDLAGWQVIGYNGNGGVTYQTVNLSGIIPDQGGCMGTLGFAFSAMQNGAPDGLALIDNLGAVIEFISYEGSFTATDGPASGMTSVDVGVSETGTTPVGQSLQLSGSGSASADFVWQAPAANTEGLANTGQTFTGCAAACTIDPDCDDGLFCNGAETCVASACQAGTNPCDDGVACTDDTCDEVFDTCTNTPNDANCDDGLFCNGAETCDPVLGCQAGANPCLVGDVCLEATDTCCTPAAEICNDAIDNDCDGLTDCDDPDCAGDPACACLPDGAACTSDAQCCGDRCRLKNGELICD
ncbi:MAG: endonuclease [Phycisphaerae bacterium]